MNSTFESNAFINETNFNTEIGGLVYFIQYLSDYLPYTVLSCFGTLIGIIGNLLIIGAVVCNKELHTTTNMLVFNLALSDIIISGFVDSFTAVGVLMGKKFFDKQMGLCHFVAAICLVACETSLMNIGFLAFNRYINICHHNLYKKMFTFRKTVIYCLITWTIGLSIDIPNLVGWGGHYYDKKTLNCVWNRLASYSYSIFFPISSIVIPCVCIFYFYIRIFFFATSAKRKVASITTTATPSTTTNASISQTNNTRQLNKSLKIAKGLFGSFMLFTACWMPYGIVVMSDYSDKLPKSVHMFTMCVAHLNSSFNPVLYAVTNPAYQRGYKAFLNTIFFKRVDSRNDKTTKISTIVDNSNKFPIASKYSDIHSN